MHAQANAADPAAVPAGGAEWRAWVEDIRRGEVAVRLRAGVHKLSRDARCPSCRGPVVIGATVRVAHGSGCGRRAAMVRMVARLGGVSRPPAAAPAPSVVAREPAGAAGALATAAADARRTIRECGARGVRRDRPARRSGGYTSQPPAMAAMQEIRRRREQEEHGRQGLRPWAALRCFVSGCRVAVQGWAATVRGAIRRIGGTLQVRLDFDDWPRSVHPEVPEWWSLDDLLESATVAA